MAEPILVINAGSSSLKSASFVLDGSELKETKREQISSLDELFSSVIRQRKWSAIGHRVVHGGAKLVDPVRITAEVLSELRNLVPLAPLHQPGSLAPIERISAELPNVPQFACFDTAFHATQPELATIIPLPAQITGESVKRYGFHGLSYEYIASVLDQFDERAARGKTVVLHLGNGASMCALEGGKSIATTMGFSALDGLVMSTRSGSLDPGVVLYLVEELKMGAQQIEKILYKESGLLAVSGISGDMRELLASESPRASVAVDLFIYRIRRELGSLVAALGGLDAIVFTAGIGEHSPEIRKRVCRECAWLGIELDPQANDSNGARITTKESRIAAWVIPTDEELMIARHIVELNDAR